MSRNWSSSFFDASAGLFLFTIITPMNCTNACLFKNVFCVYGNNTCFDDVSVSHRWHTLGNMPSLRSIGIVGAPKYRQSFKNNLDISPDESLVLEDGLSQRSCRTYMVSEPLCMHFALKLVGVCFYGWRTSLARWIGLLSLFLIVAVPILSVCLDSTVLTRSPGRLSIEPFLFTRTSRRLLMITLSSILKCPSVQIIK